MHLDVEEGSLKLFLASLYCLACDDPQKTCHSQLLRQVLYSLPSELTLTSVHRKHGGAVQRRLGGRLRVKNLVQVFPKQ